MESHLLDWLQLAVRWLHMITGIAWIGASFYFVWLNNNIRPPKIRDQGDGEVDGELQAIHGGGFYKVQRFALAPKELPHDLHWFYWEAYTTWISGITLLILVYYLNPKIYLIDTNIANLSVPVAIGLSIGTILAGYIVYDLLQRSPLGKNNAAFGIVFFAFVVAAGWFLCHNFGGRAAYIHVGAMLGTIMVANVSSVIVPSQRELVNAKKEGRLPDKKMAEAAKTRSLHNNYITLPVLFIMISNHYPFTFSHEYNWIVLAAIALAGALVRHWFNLRGQGRSAPWLWAVSAIVFIAAVVLTIPKKSAGGAPVAFKEIDALMGKHCRACHSEKPTDQIFKIAPNGVKYDTPEQIQVMAAKIKARAVDTPSMPFGNKTNMTKEEREVLGRWIDSGAKID